MARQAGRSEIREQHAQLLTGIALWLEQQPDTTPLELGVFTEVAARVRERSKAGAIVRVRIKNLGAHPRERTGQEGRGMSVLWSFAEMDQLREMVREGKGNVEIGEAIGRSTSSVRSQKTRLGLVSPPRPPTPKAAGTPLPPWLRHRRPEVLAAARRIRARRQAELSCGAAD